MSRVKQYTLKEIKVIKLLLTEGSSRLDDLSSKQLKSYILYRVDSLLAQRQVLIRDELIYLLCETGPGNLRFDPDLVEALLPEAKTLTSDTHDIQKQQEILSKKEGLHQALVEDRGRPMALGEKLQALLEDYLGPLEISGDNPIQLKGDVDGTGFEILVYAHEWVMPSKEFFTELKRIHATGAVPIVIGRKIHGVLFPLFKQFGIVGFNTYSTLVSEEFLDKLRVTGQDLEKYNSEYVPSKVKYYDRFQGIEHLAHDDAFTQFISETVPAHVRTSKFLDLFPTNKQAFTGYVDEIKAAKVKKVLAMWAARRAKMKKRIG